jgi:voltage-gated potassium channel Kch
MIVNAFMLITWFFAVLYWFIGTTANFNVELSRIDALYFALGTLTTAGTGTIAPTSDLARAIVSGQMVLDLAFIASAVTIAVTRWSERPR